MPLDDRPARQSVRVKDLQAGDILWPTLRKVVAIRATPNATKRAVSLEYTKRNGAEMLTEERVSIWGANTTVSILKREG